MESMGDWRYAFILLFVAVAAFLVWLQEWSEKRRALRHMEGRQPLTDVEFGKQFFPPDRADIAARLRQIMARHIAVDLSRLHPDDLIVDDLRMDSLDSLATVEFLIEIEKEFGISVPDAAAEKMRNLRDVTDYVYEATRRPKVEPSSRSKRR